MTSTRTKARPNGEPPGAEPPALNLDDCWQAVMDRSPAADGLFVFAVASTRIYCRPSCPARRPNRANVRFYRTAAEARSDGYRACRRCQPDDDAGSSAARCTRTAVVAACRMIDDAERPPTLAQLARTAGLSASHLHRAFKHHLGLTPRQYAAGTRAERLRNALRAGTTVTAAIHQAGFEAASRYYAAAPEILGMSTRSYRSGGNGERIEYTVANSSVGKTLVAVSEKGLCAVLLGDDRDTLVGELGKRFPKAQIVPGTPALKAHADDIVSYIADRSVTAPDLPLDLRGTAFQLRVWNALRRIPPGTTTSYGTLAKSIGAPSAVRAVAAACGANPLAVIVPCHRVVAANGVLTGYRWGIDRKQKLLDSEGNPPDGKSHTSSTKSVVKPRKMR